MSKKLPKRTPWFCASVSPHWPGWYEVHSRRGWAEAGHTVMRYWSGGLCAGWMWVNEEGRMVGAAVTQMYGARWRGLTAPASEA